MSKDQKLQDLKGMLQLHHNLMRQFINDKRYLPFNLSGSIKRQPTHAHKHWSGGDWVR